MDTMPLLDEYVRTASQDAFRQIVERYINVVYAAARRQMHDEHLAQDVTQAVFMLLARKAKSIPRNRPISAWLLKTTRYAASNAWRLEQRRRQNETRAATVRQADQPPDEPELRDLEAILDEGIGHLSGQDRDALLLKFFEQSSLREIGTALGISEVAAQKRVSRAVDRLRDFFRKRGVTVSVATLTVFLTTRAAEAAPATLTALAASAPISGPIASGTTLNAVLKGALIMTAMEKAKVAAIAAVVLVLGIGGGVVAVQYASQKPNPIVASAPVLASTAPAFAALPVQFSDGTLVEVLGIQEQNPADPSKWWGPDGLPRPRPSNFRNSNSVNDIGMRSLRFRLQMTDPTLADKTLHAVVVGSKSEATTGNTEPGAILREMLVTLPQNLTTTSIRIAVSSGPWMDEITHDVATGESIDSAGASIRIGNISEQGGMTQVETSHLPFRNTGRDERMVLIVNGREIQPYGITHSFTSTTYSFKCAKSEVTKAIFRSRPFEWIEMNNVSLMPTDTPTNVQITPVSAPTTAP